MDGKPSLLYHYTTADGVWGILDKREIFATEAAFANDREETAYIIRCIDASIKRTARAAGFDKIQMEVLRLAKEVSRSVLAGLTEDGFYVFATSFCTKWDLLSQWRAYGIGRGYAVGFDKAALDEVVSGGLNKLGRVTYSKQAQRRSLDAAIVKAVVNAGSSPAPNVVFAASLILALTFKHTCFREEREWRAITLRVQDDFPKRLLTKSAQ